MPDNNDDDNDYAARQNHNEDIDNNNLVDEDNNNAKIDARRVGGTIGFLSFMGFAVVGVLVGSILFAGVGVLIGLAIALILGVAVGVKCCYMHYRDEIQRPFNSEGDNNAVNMQQGQFILNKRRPSHDIDSSSVNDNEPKESNTSHSTDGRKYDSVVRFSSSTIDKEDNDYEFSTSANNRDSYNNLN